MRKMGLDFGLETNSFEADPNKRYNSKTCLRRFRWLFYIDNISARGVNALPPYQSSRPNLSFTEMNPKHLNETYFYPAMPDWRPINLVLYDVVKNNSDGARIHPVISWLEKVYEINDREANWYSATENGFIQDCDLEMLDGCGNVVEKWIFEQVWPQAVDFGTLDMSSSDVMTCSLTLRYARAYIQKNTTEF